MLDQVQKKAERIRYLLQTPEPVLLSEVFEELEVGDLAELYPLLSGHEQAQLFMVYPDDHQSELFSHLNIDDQKFLIETLEIEHVDKIFNEMDPVDRTQFLEELDPDESNIIIERLKPEERRMAWQLLSYPEDSVGRLMTPEFVTLNSKAIVSEGLDYIRWVAEKFEKEQLHNIFIVDEQNRYVGQVGLADLVTCDPPSLTVERIMGEPAPTLNVHDDQTIAVDYFRKYDRVVFAVTDQDGRIVGSVSAENMFDAAEEEATEDIQQFGGQSTLEDSYFSTSFMTLIRKRAGWLSILFLGEIYTTSVLEGFDAQIAQMRFIVYFLPLIIASGGNSGSQAASLVIRGLAVREMNLRDWSRVFWRELLMGLCLGLILGLLGLLKVLFWSQGVKVAVIVGLSLLGIVILGAVIGSMLPFMLKKARIDPAISSSPFVASLVDIFGIMIMFEIAIFITKHWDKISSSLEKL